MNEDRRKGALRIRFGYRYDASHLELIPGPSARCCYNMPPNKGLLLIAGFVYLSPLLTRLVPRPVREVSGEVMTSALAEEGRKDLIHKLGGCQ